MKAKTVYNIVYLNKENKMIDKNELIKNNVDLMLITTDVILMDTEEAKEKVISFMDTIDGEGQVSVAGATREEIISYFKLNEIDSEHFIVAAEIKDGEIVRKEVLTIQYDSKYKIETEDGEEIKIDLLVVGIQDEDSYMNSELREAIEVMMVKVIERPAEECIKMYFQKPQEEINANFGLEEDYPDSVIAVFFIQGVEQAMIFRLKGPKSVEIIILEDGKEELIDEE